MSEHLSQTVLNAVVDGQLEGAELVRANEHLTNCAACSSECLSYGLLRRRVAEVGARYELPRGFEARLRRAGPSAPQSVSGRWGAVAALVVVLIGAVVMQRVAHSRAEQAALVSEVVDQHIATLAANAPEVVSSDRHTVKPWFQGKLPFSFNLPATMPADMTLDGANLAYIGGRPVAQLLFSIGKHRASMFVEQSGGTISVSSAERAGFHVAGFRTAELEGVAVSDAEPTRVTELVRLLREAQ